MKVYNLKKIKDYSIDDKSVNELREFLYNDLTGEKDYFNSPREININASCYIYKEQLFPVSLYKDDKYNDLRKYYVNIISIDRTKYCCISEVKQVLKKNKSILLSAKILGLLNKETWTSLTEITRATMSVNRDERMLAVNELVNTDQIEIKEEIGKGRPRTSYKIKG